MKEICLFRMLYTILTTLMFVFGSVSCSSDDDDPRPNTEKPTPEKPGEVIEDEDRTLLIAKIESEKVSNMFETIEESKKVVSFVHDEDSILLEVNITVTKKEGDEEFHEERANYELVYDNEGLLIGAKRYASSGESGNEAGTYIAYSNDEGAIVVSDGGTTIYELNEEGQVVSSTASGTETSYEYDAAGNVTKVTRVFDTAEKTIVDTYVYDTKKSLMLGKGVSPMVAITILEDVKLLGANNCTKLSTDIEGTTSGWTASYEYDKYDYPSSSKSGGQTWNKPFEDVETNFASTYRYK